MIRVIIGTNTNRKSITVDPSRTLKDFLEKLQHEQFDLIVAEESILPQAVRTEIYDQLSKWLFEFSSSAARATFEYTIKKQ